MKTKHLILAIYVIACFLALFFEPVCLLTNIITFSLWYVFWIANAVIAITAISKQFEIKNQSDLTE
ncbi:MAG: hypothetical protein LBR26_09605 [Prevotella sp.]|jgi:hypothetical protein|nr:hypothetical protein [Prevotella sp.]